VAEPRQLVAQAQAQAAADAAARSNAAALSEEAEVEQAAKTLLMARRTAEAMEQEARGQAQSLLGEAKTRADRQLAEAQAEAEELIRRARAQADEEYADRRNRALEEVQGLEDRRSQLGDVLTQLEARLAGYREDLSRTAEELTLLASDPDRLGARPTLSIPPDEVLPRDSEVGRGPVEEFVEVDGVTDADVVEVGSGSEEPEVVDLGDSGGSEGQPWEPGSWSRVAAEAAVVDEPSAPFDADEAEDGSVETISLQDDTVLHDTLGGDAPGQRDRYLEELDSAVNEAVPVDDEAMTAFFEGSEEARGRRFGWRR
jgi:hypothetical protein